MNSKKYILASIGLFIISCITAFSQSSQTQYFMNFPQSSMVNPAFRPANKVTVGIPVLSNTYISLNNNLLNLAEIFQTMPGSDSTMTILHPDFPKSDRDKFIDGLGKNTFISTDISTQILGLGFTVANDWYVDISLSQKATAAFYLPGDFFRLAFEGNESFVGSSIDMSGLGFEALQYMETSVAISKNITDKLRVGGRAKLLFGGAGAAIDNQELAIDVNSDFSHTIRSDVRLNISGPFTINTDSDNIVESIEIWDEVNPFDILINTSNTGMAFDIGADYKLLHNLNVSASIIDLGFVGWKSDIFNLRSTNEFIFDGFDVSSVINGDQEFDVMMENFKDSLLTSFQPTSGSANFTMGLPAKIYIGAQYRPVDFLGLGILSRSVINQGHYSQALSLSANLYAGNILSSSLTYTMANRSYNNLGFGFSLKLGPVQFYTIADQLPLSWIRFEADGGDTSILMPNRLDYINLRFGMNLVFGKMKQKLKDKPMLLD